MAISIDWGTKVIFVPQSFLTSLGGGLYELDTDLFRLALKDLEDGEEGINFLDTHRHNTVVLLGGIGYARTIEIINGYTVTFEDGQYAVNLVGSNNNIADVTNVNQVSIRPNNSAGLIQTREIQYSSFEGGVTIDVANGVAGVAYPTGTPRQPVNNVADALFIAELYGFRTLHIVGDITFDTGDDISEYLVLGKNALRTHIFLLPGADAEMTEFREVTITGTLDQGSLIRNSYVYDLNYVNGFIHQCMLDGTIALGSVTPAHIMDCFSGADGVTVDFTGDHLLNLVGFNGDITIEGRTGSTDPANIHINSGTVTLAASVTDGAGMDIQGVGRFVNNSLVTPTQVDLVTPDSTADAVWDELADDHLDLTKFGGQVRFQYLLAHHKTITDPVAGTITVYESDGTTVAFVADLWEDAAGTTPYAGAGAERRDSF